MPSNYLVLCQPLLILHSIFPSIRVFPNESGSSQQVTKVLELQLQHQAFHEYSWLISFRIDWFDLLAVQGTLKRLLQPPPLISDFFRGFSDAELLVVPCVESLVSPLSFILILWPENSHACFRLSSVLSLQEVLSLLSTCSGPHPYCTHCIISSYADGLSEMVLLGWTQLLTFFMPHWRQSHKAQWRSHKLLLTSQPGSPVPTVCNDSFVHAPLYSHFSPQPKSW